MPRLRSLTLKRTLLVSILCGPDTTEPRLGGAGLFLGRFREQFPHGREESGGDRNDRPLFLLQGRLVLGDLFVLGEVLVVVQELPHALLVPARWKLVLGHFFLRR